jgi:hypothetical protein
VYVWAARTSIKAAAEPMLDYSDFCVLLRMNFLSRGIEEGADT